MKKKQHREVNSRETCLLSPPPLPTLPPHASLNSTSISLTSFNKYSRFDQSRGEAFLSGAGGVASSLASSSRARAAPFSSAGQSGEGLGGARARAHLPHPSHSILPGEPTNREAAVRASANRGGGELVGRRLFFSSSHSLSRALAPARASATPPPSSRLLRVPLRVLVFFFLGLARSLGLA